MQAKFPKHKTRNAAHILKTVCLNICLFDSLPSKACQIKDKYSVWQVSSIVIGLKCALYYRKKLGFSFDFYVSRIQYILHNYNITHILIFI